MALEQAGVELILQNLSQFNSGLAAATAALDKFSSTAEQSGGRVSAGGNIMTGALRQVGTLAVSALEAAGSAIIGFGTGSIQAASEFEKSMSLIAGLTDTSSQEIQGLSKSVLELSRTLPQSPKELADALYFISSSGYQGAQAMDILTVSAKAAAAGLGDTKTIADTVTSAMNAYGAQNLSAAQATDILTMAVVKGKGEPDQLAGAFSRVLPIAAQMGVNFQQVAASMATMTNVGISADEAATALRGTLSAFLKPSKEAAKALADLGLSAESVQQSIREKGLLGTLQMLMEKTHGNTSQLAAIIPNVRALTGVLATAGNQAKTYAETLDAMNNAQGRTEKAFQEASKTYDFQVKVLQNALTGLQIAIGSAALPALTSFISGGLVPAIHSLTDFVNATREGHTWLSQLGGALQTAGHIITTGALPALQALELTAMILAGVSIPALVTAIGSAVAAMAPFLAMAIPIAGIAVAIAGVATAWTNFADKVTAATDQLLSTKQFWTESTAALQEYGAASESVQGKLKPLADALQNERDALHGQIEDLGRRMAAGMVTEEQYHREMDALNQQAVAIRVAAGELKTLTEAEIKTQAATLTASAGTQQMTSALAENADQVQLTEKELADLQKQLEKTFKEGTQAVGDYVKQAASLMEQLTDKNKSINDRITADQAAAYAQQAAAQRAHLGQMLEDYTLAQVRLGNITSQQADTVLAAIEQQFGVADQTSSRTFLHMEQAIDKFAASGGQSVTELSGKLGDLSNDAIATKIQMDALAKKYTAELIQNFKDGKIDAEQLREALEAIPARVYSEVTIHTNYTVSGDPGHDPSHAGPGGRASGGGVEKGKTYTVGERGPETFVPTSSGYIVPNMGGGRASPPASASQIISNRHVSNSSTYSPTYNYAPHYGRAPKAPLQDFHAMKAWGI